MPFDALNWEAEIRPLFDVNGDRVPPEIGRGVYRSDTDDIIGIAGPHTKLVQHHDVVDPVLQTLKDQGYEIKERLPGRRDLEDLRGHKGAFVNFAEAKTGAVMKATIITGDFTRPTGPSSFLPDGPPTLFREYNALNSHDSTYAAQMASRYKNVVCMNGLTREDFSATVKGKHTSGFSIEAFKRQILMSAEMMERDTQVFERYIKTPLTHVQAEAFIKATIAKLKDKPGGEPNWSEPLRAKLLDLFAREPKTVWGLYMAMTYWATHGDLKGNSVELTARIGRDERVAQSMRTSTFKQLLAA